MLNMGIDANGGQPDSLPDFFAEDGWLMLQHNMGFDKQGEAKQYKDYSYPYVVLYNRERGIARGIAYINHAPYTFNSVEISLSVSSSRFTNNSANLFSTLKPVGLKDVAHYPAQASTLSPLYVHDAGQFVYGDIPLCYDPCVSLSELDRNLKISPVQTATFKLAAVRCYPMFLWFVVASMSILICWRAISKMVTALIRMDLGCSPIKITAVWLTRWIPSDLQTPFIKKKAISSLIL